MKRLNIFIAFLIGVTIGIVPNQAVGQRSGVEIWSQTCNRCHMSQPTSRYDARHWNSIIRHMKIHARLTDKEAELVGQFLIDGAAKITDSNSVQELDTNALASENKISEKKKKEIEKYVNKIKKE